MWCVESFDGVKVMKVSRSREILPVVAKGMGLFAPKLEYRVGMEWGFFE